MRFHIEHTTDFLYSEPAVESFSEIRLRPRNTLRQSVSRHVTHVQPSVEVEPYTDYFGNHVETVSIPFRHDKLVVKSSCDVTTYPAVQQLQGPELSLSEARRLYQSRRCELYDFLRPSHFVPFIPELQKMAATWLPAGSGFFSALKELNHSLHTQFRYRPGATNVATKVPDFLRAGEGVCQDFTHLMIALCRLAGVPARYVSGYIETVGPTDPGPDRDDSYLIGATASHAWVEVFTPSQWWVGLDPTNDMLEGERHVQIAIGRDYHDVPPLKGIFKGANNHTLSVQVSVKRVDHYAVKD